MKNVARGYRTQAPKVSRFATDDLLVGRPWSPNVVKGRANINNVLLWAIRTLG